MARSELLPGDMLFGCSTLDGSNTLADFWRWAYGDLCDDAVRGAFAEWMVARILGLPQKRRVAWANSDLITPDRVRIEVKSSSYWQSWKLVDEFGQPKSADVIATQRLASAKNVIFRGLKALTSVGPSGAGQQPGLKSDIYFFCMQIETDHERWNPLDLAQWEFFLADRTLVESWSSSSVNLAKLRALFPALSAAELRKSAAEMIAKAAAIRGGQIRSL